MWTAFFYLFLYYNKVMYSDTHINFWELSEIEGQDKCKEILTDMADNKPFFVLDVGVRSDDIYQRVERIRDCINGIEDDEKRAALDRAIHFACGIQGDLDSVENRFDYVENLESTILDFKNSDDDYSDRLVAIGDGGIDHDWDSAGYDGRNHDYFDHQTIDDERNLFALQLTLAKKLNLPFILHSREGFKDTMDVLKAIKWNKGVVHGFCYGKSELDFFLDLGWYIGFSGTVTYGGKNMFSDMAELVSYVPKDRILIETDTPYYAPVPIRNSTNNPCNINYIYEYVAAKRNISTHKLSDIVDNNCTKLFGL